MGALARFMNAGYRVRSTMTVERDGIELELDLTGIHTPYVPATRIQPSEGDEIEDLEATLDGQEFDLTETEYAHAEQLLRDVEFELPEE